MELCTGAALCAAFLVVSACILGGRRERELQERNDERAFGPS